MIAAIIILFFCVWAIAHSYVLYPFLLQLKIYFFGGKEYVSFSESDELPFISILMAAYNEEQVIEQKIRSIFDTTYPIEKIELLVGSDNSNDKTNEIIKTLAVKFPNLQFVEYKSRHGKVNIVNQLSEKASGQILVITDANVMFENKTLFELIRFFKDENIGLVDTQMKNYGLKKDGISFQEKSYISREVFVKHLESKAFGVMIGPFGGCFAIRKTLFEKVPSNFLVDDFYECMSVLSKGKAAINNLDAKVYEDVSNILSIEFNRKIRIATGDFQNLIHFRKLLWPPYRPVAFCFMSHKVIRWFGPFFIIGAFLSNLVLAMNSNFFQILFLFQLIVTILPIIDFILKKFHLHIVFLRFITHFYTMNLSLLIGFVKSIKGVKSNVWKPTRRLQG